MSQPSNTCLNCGSTLTGAYCSQCGEKVFSEHDKSIKHFIQENFHFITHLDGKYLKSLKLVFFKPGFLSLEYCRGIRKKYFKPVSLFLVGVLIYLIFPLLPGLNMSFYQNHSTFYRGMHIEAVHSMSVNYMEKKGITEEELARRYDAKSPKFAKVMILLVLPFTAGILWILFFRKRQYLFDHLIIGTEMNTLLLYAMFIFLPLLLNGVVWSWFKITGNDLDYGDPIIVPIQIILMSVGWGYALRRFYGLGRWETVLKTFLFYVLHAVFVYIVYRLILFMTVMLFL